MKGQGPTLSDVLRQTMEAATTMTRTAIPGVVSGTYPGNDDQVDVEIAVSSLVNGSPVIDPQLRKVPVLHAGTSRVYTRYPLRRGDPVWVNFGDRDLDNWKARGGDSLTEANTNRKHDLTDAVCWPVGWGQGILAVEMNDTFKGLVDLLFDKATLAVACPFAVAILPEITILKARLEAAGL